MFEEGDGDGGIRGGDLRRRLTQWDMPMGLERVDMKNSLRARCWGVPRVEIWVKGSMEWYRGEERRAERWGFWWKC